MVQKQKSILYFRTMEEQRISFKQLPNLFQEVTNVGDTRQLCIKSKKKNMSLSYKFVQELVNSIVLRFFSELMKFGFMG